MLRDVNLHAAKVRAIPHQHDLVLHADTEFGQLLEVCQRSVVGVDHLSRHVSRWRRPVEGRKNSRVILKGIAAVQRRVDMLRSGPSHKLLPVRVKGFDENFDGLVQQHLVGHDLGLEPCCFELVSYVDSGLVVFGRARPVRFGCEDFEVFASQPGVGNLQECRIPLRLFGEVGITEYG